MSFERDHERCIGSCLLRPCATHRALAIDEILRMITMRLRGDSTSLLALATTCKAWSAVAVEGLWTEITSGQVARISSLRVGILV